MSGGICSFWTFFKHFLCARYLIDSRDIEMNETWKSYTIGKGFQVKRQRQVTLCTVKKNKERGVPNTGKCSQKILLRIDDIWAKLNGKTEAYGGTLTITRSKAKNHGLVRKCGQIPMTGTQLFRESDYTWKTREPRPEETDKHWRAPASSWTQWHATEAF